MIGRDIRSSSKFYPFYQIIGKRDVEAKLLPGTVDTGRMTPDPDVFQQLPINENRQQESYALIGRNKTIDSKQIFEVRFN